MVSKDLLAKAAESFGFEVETLVFISNSCNEVYRFTKNNNSSYFWWLSNWDGDESRLSEAQHNAISHAIHLIQQGQMFDGCDIQL